MNASPRGFHDPPEFVLKTKGHVVFVSATEVRGSRPRLESTRMRTPCGTKVSPEEQAINGVPNGAFTGAMFGDIAHLCALRATQSELNYQGDFLKGPYELSGPGVFIENSMAAAQQRIRSHWPLEDKRVVADLKRAAVETRIIQNEVADVAGISLGVAEISRLAGSGGESKRVHVSSV